MEYEFNNAEEKRGMALVALICLAFAVGMINEFAGIAIVAVGLIAIYAVEKALNTENDISDDGAAYRRNKRNNAA